MTTAACTQDDTIACNSTTIKNLIITNTCATHDNSEFKEITINNNQHDDLKEDKNVIMENTQTCSRQLVMYLESRGIQAWDDNYTCIDEAASASTSSLESHEMISEGNSSGYNSSAIDCNTINIKNKRDSDSLSASSQSDSGEINCIVAMPQTDECRSLESSVLNNSLHELECSMVEILRNNLTIESADKKITTIQSLDEICEIDNNYGFYDALRKGDIKQVKQFVASGFIEDLNEPDWNVSGDPPLLVAATNHCLPVLR